MRILITILHHWNPNGGGRHQSLRSNPLPRIQALQSLILAFTRFGSNQFHLNLEDQAAYPANISKSVHIDLHVLTDGKNHVLDQLDNSFNACIERVASTVEQPLMLGFKAQQHLALNLSDQYDLYGYFEDDVIVHDPYFFLKVKRFAEYLGAQNVLLPQRYELMSHPSSLNKLYIDGQLPRHDINELIPSPPPSVLMLDGLLGPISFESPSNPHAGCFVLTHQQLHFWTQQPWWQDQDCGFVSPLESAATLGLLKSFKLYKPSFANASWLEVEHWGSGFLTLMARATRKKSTNK